MGSAAEPGPSALRPHGPQRPDPGCTYREQGQGRGRGGLRPSAAQPLPAGPRTPLASLSARLVTAEPRVLEWLQTQRRDLRAALHPVRPESAGAGTDGEGRRAGLRRRPAAPGPGSTPATYSSIAPPGPCPSRPGPRAASRPRALFPCQLSHPQALHRCALPPRIPLCPCLSSLSASSYPHLVSRRFWHQYSASSLSSPSALPDRGGKTLSPGLAQPREPLPNQREHLPVCAVGGVVHLTRRAKIPLVPPAR